MRTDELLDVLAAGAQPVDPARTQARFGLRLAVAVLPAVVLVLWLLGPRPDLAQVATLPMFWLKVAMPVAIGLGAAVLLYRLGLPGVRLRAAPAAALSPIVLLWAMGAASLLLAPAGERLPLLLGSTWRECPLNVALLSVPAWALAMLAVRGLAPTRLPQAGAAAGLFAGAAAAAAYALHCPEMALPFLAVWYVLGMAIPAAAGALAGRRLLRW
ncbi:MAG: DUF1109 domain-containing protein [Burkholderiales bacterium]|nr:DUF1109 domain-containing protein [Burkholderiales bacterium]